MEIADKYASRCAIQVHDEFPAVVPVWGTFGTHETNDASSSQAEVNAVNGDT